MLVGMRSGIDRHFFFADFDNVSEKVLLERVGKILFNKRKFGPVYMLKTGRGWHLLCFSVSLSLEEYVEILKEMKADEKFVEWVEKVGYGVLRLSRRSSHLNVPYLYKVLIPPWSFKEDVAARNFYFKILNIESSINNIVRVVVRT
ncbi:MAG: hypothetical protein QW279_12140 [Candidatus Jordarchaeaceae archaeon]